MTEFDEAAWGRIGGMKHHLIASLELRAVCLKAVGVCLMALGYGKMITGDVLEETSVSYEVCNKLRGLCCRVWDEGKLKIG